jgi:hypothetical protein
LKATAIFKTSRKKCWNGWGSGCRLIEDWQFSSYNLIQNEKQTKLHKKEVLDWFDGEKWYVDFHNAKQDLKSINNLIID